MEKSKKILKVENLKKAYYSTSRTGESITYPVLNNVSFEIEEGEFVGIMGRSGCGKTTLLKAVGMLDKPDDGTIYYKDKDTKDIYRAELARLRRTEIAFVFQDYYLMDSLSIKENIMLPLILDEADVQESKKKCEEILEKQEFQGIKLEDIRGHKFPDFILNYNNKKYGVEIKSSEKGNWTIPGNSVFENTFVFFGSFKEKENAFKVKLTEYWKAVKDIKVTHSPRFEISVREDA